MERERGKSQTDVPARANYHQQLYSDAWLIWGVNVARVARLDGVSDEATVFLCADVHPRPASEIVGGLRAAMQHDDQRKFLTVIATGNVELIRSTSSRIRVVRVDECPALRNEVTRRKPGVWRGFQPCVIRKGIGEVLQPPHELVLSVRSEVLTPLFIRRMLPTSKLCC